MQCTNEPAAAESTNPAATDTSAGRGGTRPRLGFLAATAALVAVFAASGAPIPLYERYRLEDGLTTGDLSVAAVAYFVAVMITLVVFGRLSDYLGRRVVSLAAVALAAAGCLVLLNVHGLPTLMAGRVLQGLACGLGSSAIAAYIVDTAPARPRWVAATTAAGAPLTGLTVGAVGSGALAEYGPAPEHTSYLAALAILAAAAVLVLLARPDPVRRKRGVAGSLRPRVSLPATARRLIPAAIAVFCATWALGGFYQAFSPTISAQNLGTGNVLVAGIVFASFMAPYALGGPLTGRLAPRTAQRGAIVVFAVAAAGIVLGLQVGAVVVVIVCGIVAGSAQGAAFTATVRALLARTGPGERAGLMASVYVFSYGGAAVPSLIAGRLSAALPLAEISLGYAALAIVAAFVVLVARPTGTTDH